MHPFAESPQFASEKTIIYLLPESSRVKAYIDNAIRGGAREPGVFNSALFSVIKCRKESFRSTSYNTVDGEISANG